MRRMTRIVAALWWTSLFLVGLPAALIRLVGWPLPDHTPTRPELEGWVQQPLTRASMIGAVAIVAWAMWAALLATVLAAGYRRFARLCRHLPDIRLPGPVQGLSAAMLGTITVSTSVGATAAPAAAHATVAAADTTHPIRPTHTAQRDQAQHTVTASPLSSTRTDQPRHTRNGQRGGTGPGPTRTQLANPQPDRLNTDRHRQMRPQADVESGHIQAQLPTVDRVPVCATTPGHPVPTDAADTTTGHQPRPAIEVATRHPAVAVTVATTEPGTTPGVPAWTQDAPSGVHRVVRGDNLWNLAGSKLGNPNRWRDIYVLNRGHRQANGYALTDPDEIHIGWVLILPATSPAPVKTAQTGPASPGQAAPQPVAPAASSTPAPARSAPAAPASGSAAPATTGRAAGSPAEHRPSHAAGEDGRPAHGVHLPSDGWVSLSLATTIAAAAALLRLHRRRRARLGFLIPLGTDPQPAPLPDSLSTVDAAGSRMLDLDNDEDQPLRGVVPAPLTTRVPVGIDGDGAEVSLLDLPGPGLALTGPGAEPAARAVLAAALATGVVQSMCHRPIVVTSADTLGRLLPAGAAPVGLDPQHETFDEERLVVVADLATAVTRLEEEMIHRRRLLDTMGNDTVALLNARNDHAEYQPAFVVLLDNDPRYAARVRAVATHRDALHLHPVIIGDLDGIAAVHVDHDGTVDPMPTTDIAGQEDGQVQPVARLAVLSARDLADVLALVAEVAPRPEDGHDPENPQPSAEAAIDASSPVPLEIPVAHTDTPALARLTVLGPVAVSTDAGPLGSGMRSGSYAVLAVLAAHPRGRTLAQIAADIYPNVDQDPAINRVRSNIGTVRRVLRKATGATEPKFIVHDAGAGLYSLDPDTIDVDLWRMLTAIQAANTATDDTACLAALHAAADCYQGDFAEGHDQTWAFDYAATFRHQILSVHARIAEILEPDRPDEAIAALEAAIERDPVNEELYQRVIRIHGRLHRPDAVRRTMRLLENRLAELGELEPSEATERIAQRQLNPRPVLVKDRP